MQKNQPNLGKYISIDTSVIPTPQMKVNKLTRRPKKLFDGLFIPDDTTAYHKYYTKKYPKTTYSEEKIAYNESRDVLCKPENKFRENLTLAIQGIDEILAGAQVLKIQWLSRSLVELIFTNGAILTVTINQFSGDVLNVHKESMFVNDTKYLSGELCDALTNKKIQNDRESPVLITESCLIASYLDLNELTVLVFKTPRFDPKKVESLVDIISTKDEKPKINKINVDKKFLKAFPGPNGSHAKHLSLNRSKNLVLLWFSASGVSSNVFIYFPGKDGLELVASTLTSGLPRSLQFSALNADVILSVESSSSSAVINRRKFYKGQMSVIRSCEIPTRSRVVSCDWSTDENRTAVVNEGKELYLFCSSMASTRTTRLSYLPGGVRWMPNNCCVLVVGKFGEIQFFDVALNSLKSLVSGSPEDIFRLSGAFDGLSLEVVAMDTNTNFASKPPRLMDVNECLLLALRSGPVTMVTLGLGVADSARGITSTSVFNQHLHNGRIHEAHELLQSLDWSFEAGSCIFCLKALIDHLLRLTPSHDVISFVQSALGKFYSLSDRGSEVIAMEYENVVTNLARRFFKLLMRLKMFEKCYLIAHDVRHKDLFMELYYAARDLGETALADSSRKLAMELEEEMLECEFQPDDRDSVQSLDSLDSLYSSPRLSDEEGVIEEASNVQVNRQEAISQLIKDLESLSTNALNNEFSPLVR